MDNDDIKIKLDELTSRLKEVDSEIKDLRNSCKHLEIVVKDTNFGSGSSKVRKICKFCEEIVGFPTQKELKNNGFL